MRADVTAKNPGLIKLGAEAGMTISFLGVESGSPKILKKMHKGEFTPQSLDAVKILSENNIIALVGMMIGAPYERLRDVASTIRFSRELARAGADAIQFSIYTPLPGTRVFDSALRENSLFTLDWDRYDVLTPVMETNLGPVLDQLAQAYALYTFYLYKYFRGKIKRLKLNGTKEKLIDSGTNFIMEMIPSYIRNFLSLPKTILKTYDMYWYGKNHREEFKMKVKEALETSNKIIYDMGNTRNPYYMIKQN